jgi:transcriptional regulator with XRE-family HTH domain
MIGEALRLIRVFHDMKQTELAVRLGISQSYLSEIERGTRSPNNEIIEKYSQLFDIPVSSIWFFDEKLTGGISAKMLDKAQGLIADKILAFLRIVEVRALKNQEVG